MRYLADYFDGAKEDDKIMAIALLSGKRPKREVTTRQLREWAAQQAGIPLWLFEESYHIVGDLAETISLLLPPGNKPSNTALSEWMIKLKQLSSLGEEEKKAFIEDAWASLDKSGRFVFNKLITGGFRIGISQKLMVKALSIHTGLKENELAHRLMGDWNPFDCSFDDLIYGRDESINHSRPYPFYLAHPLEEQPEELGSPSDWSAEFKWDGIRCQLIVRGGQVFLWSRGEELITDSYPDLHRLVKTIPDGTVIDGELVAWMKGKPMHFYELQKRLNRKTISKKLIKEIPVSIIAYDLLEWQNKDIREIDFINRRAILKEICKGGNENKLIFSEEISWSHWEELEELRINARNYHSEGIMLKKKNSVYKSGRKRGEWWKWKSDPLLVDGVLLYAMRGKGRRTNLFTDYTFGAWDGDKLVPFAKAYSGLTDDEFRSISSFVRRNTVERHGPVHAVEPRLVFEIAFDGIAHSSRHKSGVALRFPRMKRWRKDKPANEAVQLEDLHRLLEKLS